MPYIMVNKVKKSVPPNTSDTNDTDDLAYLKMKNRDLAKKLAEVQKNYAEINKDKDMLQEALFNEKSKANGYANKLQDIALDCKTALTLVVQLSNTLTSIFSKLPTNNAYTPSVEKTNGTPTPITPQKQKTKAVKPMVSGCTISKPTVKLSRISDQLLQTTMNGDSRNETEETGNNSSSNDNNITTDENPFPVVNIRRLPERLNYGEIREQFNVSQEEEEEDRIILDNDRLQEDSLPQMLSAIIENSETGNSRTLQTPDDFVVNENSVMPRFTSSTPITEQERIQNQQSSPEPSTSTTPPSVRRSLFVTKRRSNKSTSQSGQYSSPKRQSKKISFGSPRVILKRLKTDERKDESKRKIKTETVSPVKRARRTAATGVSYKEPKLTVKLRREL